MIAVTVMYVESVSPRGRDEREPRETRGSGGGAIGTDESFIMATEWPPKYVCIHIPLISVPSASARSSSQCNVIHHNHKNKVAQISAPNFVFWIQGSVLLGLGFVRRVKENCGLGKGLPGDGVQGCDISNTYLSNCRPSMSCLHPFLLTEFFFFFWFGIRPRSPSQPLGTTWRNHTNLEKGLPMFRALYLGPCIDMIHVWSGRKPGTGVWVFLWGWWIFIWGIASGGWSRLSRVNGSMEVYCIGLVVWGGVQGWCSRNGMIRGKTGNSLWTKQKI